MAATPVSADIGELRHYRGDWMIHGNRAYLATTRLDEGGELLEMRLSYSSDHCPCWTRETWIMHFDADTNTYAATIKSEKTETASGKWDAARMTMTWTIDSRADVSDAKPRGARRISHRFEPRKLTWTTSSLSPRGHESQGRPMTWDILVTHNSQGL